MTSPARKPSWEYIHYLERKQKQLSQQVFLWTGIAILSTVAVFVISAIAS